MITGFDRRIAVTCMRHGAFDYPIKPFSADQIEFISKGGRFTQLVRVNYLSHES
jgi:DNA-binding NtrC family response regulator